MDKKYKGKLSHILQAICMLPLLLFGIILIIFGSRGITRAIYKEVENELQSMVNTIIYLYDTAYPGDYKLVGEESPQLYKGDVKLSDDYTMVDRLKEETGMEITLFYNNTRVLTTIFNAEGERITGTAAPGITSREVLTGERAHFYPNANINDAEYFSYYAPLRNPDGAVIGIMFAGKPRGEITRTINSSVKLFIIVGIIIMILTCYFTYTFIQKILASLLEIRSFLADVSRGDLNTELSSDTLNRNDELGEIASCAMNMQRSLRILVEQDTLTELYNRRCGEKRMRETVKRANINHTPFCIAIGDIDFFKKVNDTYGHECGDVVLKNIADLLKKHMFSKGFVIRWGGEEFLLVYQYMDLHAAYVDMDKLLHAIRGMKTVYGDHEINVTMTFGLTAGVTDDIRTLIRDADQKLYQGKHEGRNKIIW